MRRFFVKDFCRRRMHKNYWDGDTTAKEWRRGWEQKLWSLKNVPSPFPPLKCRSITSSGKVQSGAACSPQALLLSLFLSPPGSELLNVRSRDLSNGNQSCAGWMQGIREKPPHQLSLTRARGQYLSRQTLHLHDLCGERRANVHIDAPEIERERWPRVNREIKKYKEEEKKTIKSCSLWQIP